MYNLPSSGDIRKRIIAQNDYNYSNYAYICELQHQSLSDVDR